MTIYEIDAAILALTDEDGEITDIEQLDALQMEKDKKIDNVISWYKNLLAEAKAIREEEKALAERRRKLESKADRLFGWINKVLGGAKFKSARNEIKYRKSKAVVIADVDTFTAWAVSFAPSLIKIQAPPDKAAIKEYINGGGECPAEIEERELMQVA